MEAMVCTICGASFADRYRTAEPERPVNWNVALALTMLLPGAGHMAAGRYGAGAARAFLALIWLFGLFALAGDGGIIVATPLFLGVLILWAGSILDVLNLQRGGRELLAGRAMLWLVIGVTGLLMLALMAAAFSAQPG
jgi:hypothetical protein